MLAGKGLKVTQQGTQAYVRTNSQTLEPEVVNIPYIPDNASQELIIAIQGFIDHEVAHVLFTIWEAIAESYKRGSDIAQLTNIIEDPFIEREIGKKYPGSPSNIKSLHRFFIERITKPALEQLEDEMDIWGVLIVPIIRALSGQKVFDDFLRDEGHYERQVVKDWFARVPKDVLDRIPNVKTTWDSLEIAQAIWDAMQDPQQQSQSEGEGEKPHEKDSENADGDENSQGQKQDSKQASDEDDQDEAEAGSESPSDDDEQSDDEEDPGDEDSDQEESDGDDEDADPEEDDADSPDPSDEDDQDDEGERDDDADETGDGQSDSSEDDTDADDDDEEGGSGEDEGDDSEGEEDESDTDGDEGDGETDDEDTEESEEEEPENDAADIGDGDADQSDEPAKEVHGSDDRKEIKQEVGGTMTDTCDARSWVDASLEYAEFDGAIATAIQDQAIEDSQDAEYLPYTTDGDVAEKKPVSEHYMDKWLVDLEDETRQMVGAMQKDVERMMAARSRSVHVPGFRSGRLHSAGLHRLATGDERIFRRKEVHTTKDTAVTLLIDNSGSMGGAKMNTAMTAGFALSQTLERVSILNEVIGFTTAYTRNQDINPSTVRAEENRMGRRFNRVDPLYHPIYKEFGERLTPPVKKRFADGRGNQAFLCANVDGESVLFAAWRLLARKEERKVMIVLSDGAPCGSGSRPHLKKTVEDCQRMGIEMIGIGIQSNEVRHFYPRNFTINRPDELPEAVMKELKRILLG
ncbi:MAG: hypothetical protein JJ979_09775 [Roseibium sp.]|nr:hypothetical protein [Roseibium sp.]